MTQVEVLSAGRDRVGGYKVDVTRGTRVGRVSSEWFSRPADERYLSLSDLYGSVRGRTERSRTRTDDDRNEFLRKRGFSKTETAKIIERVLSEEGRKPESVFDFVQGITAVARGKTHQDARLDLEARAKKLLERAA
ncbi:hypothetical protein I6F21_34920 [Bradyrhizobium sp. NBAIM03]|nr:hypothetical protein [Bradyrhizobium sp. NBAIM03]